MGSFEAYRDEVLERMEAMGVDVIAKRLARQAIDRSGAPVEEQREVANAVNHLSFCIDELHAGIAAEAKRSA